MKGRARDQGAAGGHPDGERAGDELDVEREPAERLAVHVEEEHLAGALVLDVERQPIAGEVLHSRRAEVARVVVAPRVGHEGELARGVHRDDLEAAVVGLCHGRHLHAAAEVAAVADRAIM